jgi:hypothetical protein
MVLRNLIFEVFENKGFVVSRNQGYEVSQYFKELSFKISEF